MLADAGGAGFWAAEEGAAGRFVGWFFLLPLAGEPGAMELGYRLVRRAWGRGLGTEGVRAMLARAAQLGAERVVAFVDEENAASIRVAEKAGMRLAGRGECDGRPELRYEIDVQTVLVSR
jgi:RimJ/RimL family protein N-acetyltransferase